MSNDTSHGAADTPAGVNRSHLSHSPSVIKTNSPSKNAPTITTSSVGVITITARRSLMWNGKRPGTRSRSERAPPGTRR